MAKHYLYISLIFCSCLAFKVNAQDSVKSSVPKIGLVLSGGGAKGLAHIGVLKVLENAGIKPDYITGTSMGSIIGALYAMGYSADEISELNKTLDWTELLSDNIPLNKIVTEEKYEAERYFFSFPIRNYQFKLPSGFIEGQQLEAFFSEIAWPLPANQNFDSLPIPFRCYSVDLLSNQTFEHKKGDLVESIRASMAIPSIFSPQDIDTLLLVDGGVTLNYPVQQIKNMGADIVIGVYVGTEDNVTKESLFSFSDVLVHTMFIGGVIDAKEQLALTDILIDPNLHGLGSADFNQSQLIEQYGNDAAQQLYPQLKALADSLKLNFAPTEKFEKPTTIKLGAIQIEGLRYLEPDFIHGHSRLEIGQTLSQIQIAEAIERLYGTQYFSKVTYKLKKRTNDYTLIINAKEKTQAFLQFAPNYNNERGVGLTTNLTLRNWGIKSSRFIFTLNLAENLGSRLEFNKYIGKRQRLIHFYSVDMNKDNLDYYVSGKKLGNYSRLSGEIGTGLKYSIGLNNQIGFKTYYESLEFKPNDNLNLIATDTSFYNYTSHGLASTAYFTINTIDNFYFPTYGVIFKIGHKITFKPNVDINTTNTINSTNNSENSLLPDFQSVYVAYSRYFTIYNRLTINYGGNLGLNTDNAGISGYSFLGGLHNDKRDNYLSLAGFSFGEIIAKNYEVIHVNFRIKLINQLYVSLKTNAAFNAETISAMGDFISESGFNDYYLGYSGGLEFNSPLGPMRLMFGGNNQDNRLRVNFSVCYPF